MIFTHRINFFVIPLFGVSPKVLLAAFRRRIPCGMNQSFLFCHCKCGLLQVLLGRGTAAANAGLCNFILNCKTPAWTVAALWVGGSHITCKSTSDAFKQAGSSNLHHQLSSTWTLYPFMQSLKREWAHIAIVSKDQEFPSEGLFPIKYFCSALFKSF